MAECRRLRRGVATAHDAMPQAELTVGERLLVQAPRAEWGSPRCSSAASRCDRATVRPLPAAASPSSARVGAGGARRQAPFDVTLELVGGEELAQTRRGSAPAAGWS
jgi:hypothetical protein